MNKLLFLFFFALLNGCSQKADHGILTHVADLPGSLSENSGMVTYDGKSVWLLEDSGNNDNIFKVSLDGKIIRHLDLKGGKNKDWEDLAKDAEGNLYIGDFGNNGNEREDLVIYKVASPEKAMGDKIKAEKIKFHFPEQKKFPAKKSKRYYDTEGFFHWKNALYLITKNRTRPYDGLAMVYKIPDRPGNYEAQRITEWFTCDDPDKCSITAADISPNGKTIALLSYGFLWLITDFTFDDFIKGSIKKVDLELGTQLESLCFLNETTLLLSDEASEIGGNNLYRLRIDQRF